MEQLQIKRRINKQDCLLSLTETELELAYRMKQREYLSQDFANALEEKAEEANCRFHFWNLEEYPELTTWLYRQFNRFFDANMAHNDLIELTLNHLYHACLTPNFFNDLARYTPAICEDVEMHVEHCEQNCPKYYRCSNITEADDRSKRWELLSSLLTEHKLGTCSCNKEGNTPCAAYRYISGEWNFDHFFHAKLEN